MPEKNKSWFRRHWILTILFIIIILAIIGSVFSSNSTDNQSSNPNDAWSKNSSYTLDDCNKVCNDVYDIQAQVDVCQGSCGMYGKPSNSMNEYVNRVKSLKK